MQALSEDLHQTESLHEATLMAGYLLLERAHALTVARSTHSLPSRSSRHGWLECRTGSQMNSQRISRVSTRRSEGSTRYQMMNMSSVRGGTARGVCVWSCLVESRRELASLRPIAPNVRCQCMRRHEEAGDGQFDCLCIVRDRWQTGAATPCRRRLRRPPSLLRRGAKFEARVRCDAMLAECLGC